MVGAKVSIHFDFNFDFGVNKEERKNLHSFWADGKCEKLFYFLHQRLQLANYLYL